MFGLVVWGGFLLWLYITFLAIRYGKNLGKDKGFEKLGAFCGFMLTMGGFIVYWMAEFIYIQAKVNHLCKTEGGVTVYVTPEEWRKMIGEEEWRNLKPLTNEEIQKRYFINQKQTLIFENKIYRYERGEFRAGNIVNNRLFYYDYRGNIEKIIYDSAILVDSISQKVLLQKQNYMAYDKKIGDIVLIESPKGCIDINSQKFHQIALQYSNHHF